MPDQLDGRRKPDLQFTSYRCRICGGRPAPISVMDADSSIMLRYCRVCFDSLQTMCEDCLAGKIAKDAAPNNDRT